MLQVRFSVCPSQIGPLLAAVVVQLAQEAGDVKVAVAEQELTALKTAVTVHVAPLEGKADRVYDVGLLKGALNVCVPPQELVTVKEPLDGALLKVMVPLRSKLLVAASHGPGVAITLLMAQGTVLQGAGALMVTEKVQSGSAE